jgi:hypothetical protein
MLATSATSVSNLQTQVGPFAAGDIVTVAGYYGLGDGGGGCFYFEGAAPPSATISNVAATGTGVSVTTSAAHNLVTGQRVMIAGVTGILGVNGTWTATVTSVTEFSISSPNIGTYTSGGFIGDGGATIPSAVVAGRWLRFLVGSVDVKWWGAYGDGIHDDTDAINAALHFNNGAPSQGYGSPLDVYVPPGTYLVTAPDHQCALTIIHNTHFHGAGGTGLGSFIVCSGATGGCLEVGDPKGFSNYSEIDNICFKGAARDFLGGPPAPLDLISVHAGGVKIHNCSFQFCTRFGVIFSAGTAGSTVSGGLVGVTSMADGSVVGGVDMYRIYDCDFNECPSSIGSCATVKSDFTQVREGETGTMEVSPSTAQFGFIPDTGYKPVISVGAGSAIDMFEIEGVIDDTHITVKNLNVAVDLYTTTPKGGTITANTPIQHGHAIASSFDEANGGVISGCQVNGSNIAYYAGCVCTYVGCYSQACRGLWGWATAAAAGPTYVGCESEDAAAAVLILGGNPVILGGSLAAGAANVSPAYKPSASAVIVGAEVANIIFNDKDSYGDSYTVEIPNGLDTGWMTLERTDLAKFDGTQRWALNYSHSGLYPYLTQAVGWKHVVLAAGGYAAEQESTANPMAHGFTDAKNPQGSGLVFTGVPTINTPHHFTWRQSVKLAAAGDTYVFLNGGDSEGPAVPFLEDCSMLSLGDTLHTAGTGPFARFAGTALQALCPIEVDITTGGAVGTALFTWKIAGSIQATGVVTATTVSLGSTGIAIEFPDGTYTTSDAYTALTNWANAQDSVKCHIEFATFAAGGLRQADIFASTAYVVGSAIVMKTPGPPATRNAVCKIHNPGSDTPTVTLVWDFDKSVPNYSASSGSIG